MIEKLHYISNGNSQEEQLFLIETALDAGVTWLQFRFKNTDTKTRWQTAEQTKKLCETYKSTLIINDHVDLALAIEADGVHLGLKDTSIEEARKLLGSKIIGGTANTWKNLLQRYDEGCDYIGLGPYRHTNTKEKLDPILGLKGYQDILSKWILLTTPPPLIAIGGIQIADVLPLLQSGIHGIAFSQLLNTSTDKRTTLNQLKTLLNESTLYKR